MDKVIQEYINELFDKLRLYGFTLIGEWDGYSVEFTCKSYIIKIEKYFNEFYVSTYSLKQPSNENNLFNLLGYLMQGQGESIPEPNYYKDEDRIEECYRKQIKYISRNIQESIELIDEFYNKENYKMNVKNFNTYWSNKYPELS